MGKIDIGRALRLYDANYYKDQIQIEELENFKNKLNQYIIKIERAKKNDEDEEFFKNLSNEFLKNIFYYEDKYEINTKKYIDSRISSNGILHVIIENKKWDNPEMIKVDNINKKAFFELIYYYLENTRDVSGRIPKMKEKTEIRRLIATDSFNWFIFNSNEIEKICENEIENLYYKYKNGLLSYEKNTTKFYAELKDICLKKDVTSKIDYVYFNVLDIFNSIKEIKNLYKILHKTYLLKEKYTGEIKSNVLNNNFYQELLYILGLKEEKADEKSKKMVIKIDKNIKNSFAVQVYDKFINEKEKSENEAIEKTFELIIIWIDRLLFLKLFEGQLLQFNENSEKYRILTNSKIEDFEQLYKLFFEVLGEKERIDDEFHNRFKEIPYLNSSLFEKQDVEKELNISDLKNDVIYAKKGSAIGKISEINLLKYTIDFLNSYSFGTEMVEEGIYKQRDDIIDASVLGLIFEKINGYRDGSFYTPTSITEFMAKKIIEEIIIQKINMNMGWKCTSIEDIKSNLQFERDLEIYKKINDSINSIKICDPAVGSGHFLVSILNQIIAIKWKIGVLFVFNTNDLFARICDKYEIYIQDDTLMITDGQENQFRYDKYNFLSQKIQETLFYEKRIIIENCLFGVDINTKAAYICQLRLWIELLKNAFYKNNEMETLPNIDINIKNGNSLISKIDFKINKKITYTDSEKNIKALLRDYKNYIKQYISTNSKEKKKEIKSLINNTKNIIKDNILSFQLTVFDDFASINRNEKFRDAFEWTIEFPNIVSDDGRFIGFDGIIGNPPWGLINKKQNQTISITAPEDQLEYYKGLDEYKYAKGGSINIYKLFICLSRRILKKNGICSMIVPMAFLTDLHLTGIRKFLLNEVSLQFIEAFPERDNVKKRVFDTAKMSVGIFQYTNQKPLKNNSFYFRINDDKYVNEFYKKNVFENKMLKDIPYLVIPLVNEEELKIIDKIKRNSKKLSNYSKCYTGEIDLSLQKGYISKDSSNPVLLRGVQIQKYDIIDNISQGELIYILKDKYISTNASEKSRHFLMKRIGMQGITGIGEKNRLKMALIEKSMFCANSVNYLIPNEKDIYWLLALLNSKLINWYFKKFSTNSNVNGYEIDELPIKIDENARIKLNEYAKQLILNPKNKNIEEKIDEIVYKIYDLNKYEIKIIEQ